MTEQEAEQADEVEDAVPEGTDGIEASEFDPGDVPDDEEQQAGCPE